MKSAIDLQYIIYLVTIYLFFMERVLDLQFPQSQQTNNTTDHKAAAFTSPTRGFASSARDVEVIEGKMLQAVQRYMSAKKVMARHEGGIKTFIMFWGGKENNH